MKQEREHNATSAPLLRLLARGRPEQVCAAAIVLGALKPATPRVLRALQRAFAVAPVSVRPYVLEAIGHQGLKAAIHILVPMLVTTGPTRDQAAQLVAEWGAAAVPHLRRAAERLSPIERAILVRVALRTASPAAIDWFAAELARSSDGAARALFVAMRPLIRKLAVSRRQALGRALLSGIERDWATMGGVARSAHVRLLRQLTAASFAPRLMRALKLRRNADRQAPILAILHSTRIPPRLRPALRALLDPLLFAQDVRLLAMPAFEILARQSPPLLDAELLSRIATSAAAPVQAAALEYAASAATVAR